jgi:hypothetical protein
MLLKLPQSLWRLCTRKCAPESHSSAHNMISSTHNRRSNNRKYSTSRRNTTNNRSDNLHKSNSIRVSEDNNSIDTAHSDINSKLLANTPELLAYCLSMSTPLHPALGLTDYIWHCFGSGMTYSRFAFFVLPNHSGTGSCSDPGVNYAK